jgi:hypothetical protein
MAQEPFDIKDVFSKAMSRFTSSGGAGGFRMPDINYSPEELRDLVNERKAEVLSVGIALLAIYGAFMMYNNRTTQIGGIELRIKLLEEKEEPAKAYQKIVEENKAYISSLPPAMAENKFISELTGWAGRRGIRIKSFEPPKTKTEGFYRLTSIRMACTADDFYDALLFLSDIERSKYALKIDSFTASPDFSGLVQNTGFGRNVVKKSTRESQSPVINMDLLINSTALIEKENDVKTKQ